MRYAIIALILFFGLPAVVLADDPVDWQTPEDAPPAGLDIPYTFDLIPVDSSSIPDERKIAFFEDVAAEEDFINTLGSAAISTIYIANRGNFLMYIVILLLGWMVLMWIYSYIKTPATQNFLHIRDIEEIGKFTPRKSRIEISRFNQTSNRIRGIEDK